ncbi:YafY family protein [Nocardioides sp. zg-1228]|uniref:helix-turn-helix transcriptional regulator n=1 Tax=Nocardioides sp. zg-1228 TaxID=2763008 RepID=UPI00164279C3|nr:WYL domain-containing protein [Nocardioides sp. zg-1228]MBC2933098.1 WYL domain-containing protein [Nocardioides sp. zg-1228]QSF56714.1 WYL domain-containing protein [Nocardioides sp. zg-1228]
MRADRLVSLVLLLRQRGQLTATALAKELEVSTRTVMRDIEALSAAGVPVYAERGRHGGYSLLPGFRTELTGLNHEEALALLTADSGSGEQILGLRTALASAMRKIVDALPESHQVAASNAAQRFLVNPETDLLSRRLSRDALPDATLTVVRRAVLAGRRLRIHYASRGQTPQWRTVDPIGLVTVRDTGYLLVTESGTDRTLRLSRIRAAEELAEPAQRPEQVDLEHVWAQRCAEFLSEGHVPVQVRVSAARRDDLLDMAEAVRVEEAEPDGWLRLEVTFQDLWHAEWALWQLGINAEAIAPRELRVSLHARADAVANRYRDSAEPDPFQGQSIPARPVRA